MNETRPVFRWLAGITALFLTVFAVVSFTFGILGANGKQPFLLAALLTMGAIGSGSIAAVPKFHTDDKQRLRPFFRWLAGIATLFFVVMAVVSALGMQGEPDPTGFIMFVFCAIVFGPAAATGKREMGGNQRRQLLITAKKYADDEITLEEYGLRTKDIMKGE